MERPGRGCWRVVERPEPAGHPADLLYEITLQRRLTGSALLWHVPNGSGLPIELYVIPTALATAVPRSAQYPEGAWRVGPLTADGGHCLDGHPGDDRCSRWSAFQRGVNPSLILEVDPVKGANLNQADLNSLNARLALPGAPLQPVLSAAALAASIIILIARRIGPERFGHSAATLSKSSSVISSWLADMLQYILGAAFSEVSGCIGACGSSTGD
jgi:hypothetical protein